jgi:hypothetical protein
MLGLKTWTFPQVSIVPEKSPEVLGLNQLQSTAPHARAKSPHLWCATLDQK